VEVRDPSFSESVEKHFAQYNQKFDLKAEEERIEEEAMKKFQKIKEDQEKRMVSMREEIDQSLTKGLLIEKYLPEVTAIIGVL